MMKLQITFAIDRYDHLWPLIDGRVQPEGIEIRFIEVPAGIRHERMYNYEEYDLCEFALGGHIVAASRGLLLGRAIPGFPRRMFPHKFWAVRADRGIRSPQDLPGKRVGIVSYENTLQVAVRASLQHQYGLPQNAVRWMVGHRGMIGIDRVSGVNIEILERGKNLEKMLLAGELDAMIVPSVIEPIIHGDPRVCSLFKDPKSEEKAYYEMSGHFPIMHDVVIKQAILDKDPWVANSILEALKKSRQVHLLWMEQPPNLSFAWARELLHEERTLFGPKQWTDGLEANLKQLELMCRYACEQGMTPAPVDPSVLFIPSTLNS
jgi:4,5-dihydroxyphthalate decarboxylase